VDEVLDSVADDHSPLLLSADAASDGMTAV